MPLEIVQNALGVVSALAPRRVRVQSCGTQRRRLGKTAIPNFNQWICSHGVLDFVNGLNALPLLISAHAASQIIHSTGNSQSKSVAIRTNDATQFLLFHPVDVTFSRVFFCIR